MKLDFDQVPQWFISSSLTDNQKDTLAIKWHVYNTVKPNQNIDKQCREISEELLDNGISITFDGIKKYYYKSK